MVCSPRVQNGKGKQLHFLSKMCMGKGDKRGVVLPGHYGQELSWYEMCTLPVSIHC